MVDSVEDYVAPELKYFYCLDLDPVQDWLPSSGTVNYWLTLHIGSPEDDGTDMYGIYVLNHLGLAELKQSGTRFGPVPPIILVEYSWGAVLAEVNRRLARCGGFGWMDVQGKLRSQFLWEYEGMA